MDIALIFRISGWMKGDVVPGNLYNYADKKVLGYSVKVNGKSVESTLEKGYFTIQRSWKKGDKVETHFDMETRKVEAHSAVEADRGKISIERGRWFIVPNGRIMILIFSALF